MRFLARATAGNFLLGAFGWGLLAMVFDWWLLLSAVSLGTGALIFPVWPAFQFEIMGAAVVVGMGGTAFAWRARSNSEGDEAAA